MKLGLGNILINVIPKILEYIPTGFDAFITSDGEQFVTAGNVVPDDWADLYAWLMNEGPSGPSRDFNVLEP